MAHLLPPAGIQEPKGDLFRFYQVTENLAWPRFYDDIPNNIHDYKWTDYRQEETMCRAQDSRAHSSLSSQRFAPGPPQQLPPYTCSCTSGHGSGGGAASDVATWGSSARRGDPVLGSGWGHCPPIFANPTSLIRPLDTSRDSATRPTGSPYFSQESAPTCPPHRPPVARKGGFNYNDWLSSYNDRLPPAHLQGKCLPSICSLCQPQYLDCCPHYMDSRAYTLFSSLDPFYS